jgi:hypothetical protein
VLGVGNESALRALSASTYGEECVGAVTFILFALVVVLVVVALVAAVYVLARRWL